MNFEDEDYRRLYVRRTVTSKRLGWQGRAVRNEMLTEFDRAGIWECGDDPAADIAELVDMPIEVVRVGVERLLATKTWVQGDGRIVWPSYVEAQTCARSDRIRQQESRDRRRAEALANAKPAKLTSGVTERHAESQPSRIVTPPSLAIPPEPPERAPERARPHVATSRPESGQPSNDVSAEVEYRQYPQGWRWSEETEAAALMAGVTAADLQEHVDYWTSRRWSVPVTDLDGDLRHSLASIRTRRQTVNARASPRGRGQNPRASKQPDCGLTGLEGVEIVNGIAVPRLRPAEESPG